MIPLLIANLVVSSLILCAMVAVGARLFALTVRAKTQRNGRTQQLDPEKVAKAASAISAMLQAREAATKAQPAAPEMTPTSPVKEAHA